MKNVTVEQGVPVPWVFPRLVKGHVELDRNTLALHFKWKNISPAVRAFELSLFSGVNPNMGYKLISFEKHDFPAPDGRLGVETTISGMYDQGIGANKMYVQLTELVISEPESHHFLTEIKYVLDLWYRLKMSYLHDQAYFGKEYARMKAQEYKNTTIANLIEVYKSDATFNMTPGNVMKRAGKRQFGTDAFVPYSLYFFGVQDVEMAVLDLTGVNTPDHEGYSLSYVYVQSGVNRFGFYLRPGEVYAVLAHIMLGVLQSLMPDSKKASKALASLAHDFSQASHLKIPKPESE